jgi:hypothetical protein
VWAEIAAASLATGVRLRGDAALNLRTLIEAVSAVGVFLVVRCWAVRGDSAAARGSVLGEWVDRAAARLTGVKGGSSRDRVGRAPQAERLKGESSHRAFQGFARAAVAALIFWLNPGLIAGTSTDPWPVAAFVFATLAASYEAWFVTGVVLGAGVMLNAQLAWVAPVFVVWPLCMNAPRATVRVVIGFVAAVAAAASRELVGGGALWVTGVLLTPLLLRPNWPGRRGPLAAAWVAVPIAAELVLWPLVLPGARNGWTAGGLIALAAIVIAAGRALPARRWLACQAGLAGAGALFLCPTLFGGSLDWSARVAAELSAAGTSRAAAFLDQFAAIRDNATLWLIDLPAFGIHKPITVAAILIASYVIALLIGGAAAAVATGRRDPRALVALTLPWVMGCNLVSGDTGARPTWAACAAALWVAAGSGMTAWALVLAALAFAAQSTASV